MNIRWIQTVLASTLALGSLPTTAQEIAPEPGAELLIWTDVTTLDYMKYATDKFNAEFGYNVAFRYRGLAPIDSASRMIQDGGTARVADVAEIEHDTLGRLVVAGGVMENLVSSERIGNEFLPSAVAAATAENVSYGFPISIATNALFYNKDLLSEAPQTLEELIEFGKSFNDKKANKYTLLWDVQNYYDSRMFFLALRRLRIW